MNTFQVMGDCDLTSEPYTIRGVRGDAWPFYIDWCSCFRGSSTRGFYSFVIYLIVVGA